ncbi:MAG TPA: hypothetical protein DDZ51_16315 [Planctomycetaceae bacterium]|nr:hypothetical protein [Planctomycetaceae bacterium]
MARYRVVVATEMVRWTIRSPRAKHRFHGSAAIDSCPMDITEAVHLGFKRGCKPLGDQARYVRQSGEIANDGDH